MKTLLILVLLTICRFTDCRAADLKDIYKQLDNAMANSGHYAAEREKEINRLKNELKRTAAPMRKYDLCLSLYKYYRSYQNDSAVVYINRSIDYAMRAGRNDLAEVSRTIVAEQLSQSGFYNEALLKLNAVDRKTLGKQNMKYYYEAANHLYGEMARYASSEEMRQAYYKISDCYRDSLYSVSEKDNETATQNRIMQLTNLKRFREALALSDRQIGRLKPGTHKFAIAAFYRQFVYQHMGERDSMKYWLAESALCDVKNAIMDQASLWMLAEEVSKDGDTERAYRYISFAWEAAKKFGTRVRSWQISPLLSSIDKNNQYITQLINTRLKVLVAVVSVLALLLLLSLIYVARQRRRIASARNELKNANERLSAANGKLSVTNAKLTETNNKLNESNRVKEVYIGRYIGICAQNIDKMDAMRRNIAKLLKNRDYDELMKMAKSTEEKEKNQDEFYEDFDSAFLFLFPDFVPEFNALLREEERITLSNPKRLNTPLRIYALIRLGIDSSQNISKFLHHSLNTIYNYRAKMRNAAIGNRDDFEQKVKEIGIIKS